MIKSLCLFALLFIVSCSFLEDVLGLTTSLDAQSIYSDSTSFYVSGQYKFIAKYKNPDNEENLKVTWSAGGGSFLGDINTGDTITWIAPDTTLPVFIKYEVESDKGSSEISRTLTILNRTATITSLNPSKTAVVQGNTITFSPTINDPDNEELAYKWSVTGGTYEKNTSNGITWTSPLTKGKYTVSLTVSDKNGASDTKSQELVVYRIQGSFLVVNSGDNNIKQFSEDGDFVHTFTGFTQPEKLYIDQETLNFWVLDKSANKLTVMNLDGNVIGANSDYSHVKDASLDPRTRGAWFITDTVAVQVNHLAAFKKQILGFKLAQKVIVGSNNDLFVFDNGGSVPLLYVINTDIPISGYYNVRTQTGYHTTYEINDEFVDFLYNPFYQNIWLMKKTQKEVMRMKKDSTDVLNMSYSFTSPKLMVQHDEDRITWINDNNKLIVFNGVNGAAINTLENFEDISGIGIITYTNINEAWISDKLNHRVVRIDVSGNIITTVTGVSTPKSIAVFNGN